MKLLAIILIFLVWSSNAVRAQFVYDDLTTIKTESERFTDSLISSGIDTVVSYYLGYAACPTSGAPMAFIYWIHNDAASGIVFRQHTKRKKKKTYETFEIGRYVGIGFPQYSLSYFEKQFSNIYQDTILDHSDPYIFNYPFEAIRAKVGGRELRYHIKSAAREENLTSYKIAFIDNFRSFMLAYYSIY